MKTAIIATIAVAGFITSTLKDAPSPIAVVMAKANRLILRVIQKEIKCILNVSLIEIFRYLNILK